MVAAIVVTYLFLIRRSVDEMLVMFGMMLAVLEAVVWASLLTGDLPC